MGVPQVLEWHCGASPLTQSRESKKGLGSGVEHAQEIVGPCSDTQLRKQTFEHFLKPYRRTLRPEDWAVKKIVKYFFDLLTRKCVMIFLTGQL